MLPVICIFWAISLTVTIIFCNFTALEQLTPTNMKLFRLSVILMWLALSATMMAQGIIRHKTPVPPSSTKRQTAQPAASPAKQQAVAQLIGNMVHVQGGTFTMGRTSSKAYWCDDSDKPAHQVTVGSFYICKYEVTQKLWKAFMGSNPSWTKADNMPVEWVNWVTAQKFIRKLNAFSGKKFRLPPRRNGSMPLVAATVRTTIYIVAAMTSTMWLGGKTTVGTSCIPWAPSVPTNWASTT